MKQRPQRRRGEAFWPKIVLKKWLNITTKESDFSADEEVDSESEPDSEEGCESARERWGEGRRIDRLALDVTNMEDSSFKRHRRRNSETLRAQYIDTKELRVCVGTWNVGGKLPNENIDLEEWLGGVREPADIYVLGLQEIVPLNAGNVLGAEDNRPIPRWESLIRETLHRIRTEKQSIKCHSHPPSPSRFKPSDDVPPFEDELLSDSESSLEDEVHPFDEQFEHKFGNEPHSGRRDEPKSFQISDADGISEAEVQQNSHPPARKLSRLNHFILTDDDPITDALQMPSLESLFSNSERIGLSWPERPLHLERQMSLLSSKSFKSLESFRPLHLEKQMSFLSSRSFKSLESFTSRSFKSSHGNNKDLLSFCVRKRQSFVKIVSKQMVGIFLSVWVRTGLRKHIQNVKVSTVGVGVMGYMGNKGSVAVSMSIHQTHFCFICCHLSAGEKEGDELRRNADVREIHRRTLFNTVTDASFPRTIYDHERIVWLGDLNYRINLSYERTRELISKQEWSLLSENDQLKKELERGQVFAEWFEGDLNFPPTYKYEVNSTNYVGGDDPKGSKRKPAWCDRILSFGKGTRLLSYTRSELKLSDHRPVTAVFSSEVEVFCHRKLQKALTLTDAEIDNEKTPDIDDDTSAA